MRRTKNSRGQVGRGVGQRSIQCRQEVKRLRARHTDREYDACDRMSDRRLADEEAVICACYVSLPIYGGEHLEQIKVDPR